MFVAAALASGLDVGAVCLLPAACLHTLASMHVRPATPDDVPWLLTQLRAFADFFNTAKPLFPTEEYARGALLELIQVNSQPFFVAEQDGTHEPMGFIAGIVAPHWMNPDIRVLTEILWWVDPQYRGTSAGARLFAEFMEFGKSHCDWIVFSLEALSPVNVASLERKGFHLHERSYLLEVTR